MGVGRRLGNLLGSAGVLAAVASIAFGLPAVDRAIPAGRPVPAGEPYEIGGGVTLVPPAGALLDVTKSRPGPDRGTALFLIGAVRCAVVAAPFTGTLEEAAARLRDKITATRGYQVTGREADVRTQSGLVGRQGGYTAPGRGGRYAVYLAGPVVVEVTISGTDLELRDVLRTIEESITTIARTGTPSPARAGP
ncbi:hypothetical protein [Rhizomonospora bruguierae]|uniref:hypothetical protein n=1 Tax=Rhizomonospora bruguierae TaxID=1581705 RepID=UPI001BCD9454|nr:hypothetical protein [Micromonospora sp. NBRC 107566]